MPPAARIMPGTISRRGGTWFISRAEIWVEPMMIAAVRGRKARPVFTGE